MVPALARRQLLLCCGTVAVSALAGCSGDDSVKEIEAGIKETEEHLVEVDPKLEAAATAIDNKNWESCFSQADGIRSDLKAARESANEALSLAEEGEYDEHVTVLEGMQEYISILEEMADELEQACEAGQNGDGQQLEQHWNTLQQLDNERQQVREEVEKALEELRS